MPLLDHFRPPLSEQRPWKGFQSAWATSIAYHLNGGLLPADYYAMPLLEVSGGVEVDAATFRNGSADGPGTWTAPAPTLTLPLDATETDSAEVRVVRDFGGPQLRAVIELVSPANKDRPASRKAFAGKCANFLLRGVSVIIIDVVTSRAADLHAEILRELGRDGPTWGAPGGLFAASYRGVIVPDAPRLEIWPAALRIGERLPELPLWIEPDQGVPLDLEQSYSVTRGSLRVR